MKISKEQKELTKRRILRAAVELMEEKGYKNTSMRQIARKAEIGDATIYKYFPVKEKILLDYFDLKTQDVVAEVQQVEDLSEFSLQEKLQLFLETYLQQLLADREFVQQSLEMIFHSPQFLFQKTLPIKKELLRAYEEFLHDALESEEIPNFPLQGVLPELMVEYTFAIIFYWLRDESEEFADTTQVIDISLDLGITFLKSGVINKGFDLMGVLFKGQMFRLLGGSMGTLKKLQTIGGLMGGKW